MGEKITVSKKALGERIKKLAAEKNISLSAIETQAGYSLGTFTRWTNVPVDEDFSIFSKLATIAKILEVTIDELLGLSGTQVFQPEKMDFTPSLIVSTQENKLLWKEMRCSIPLELSLKQSKAPDGEWALAGVWSAECGRLRFLLASYCDDLDDMDEPLELGLYAAAGHNIPLLPIPTEASALQSLYVTILLQAAHQLLTGNTAE